MGNNQRALIIRKESNTPLLCCRLKRARFALWLLRQAYQLRQIESTPTSPLAAAHLLDPSVLGAGQRPRRPPEVYGRGCSCSSLRTISGRLGMAGMPPPGSIKSSHGIGKAHCWRSGRRSISPSQYPAQALWKSMLPQEASPAPVASTGLDVESRHTACQAAQPVEAAFSLPRVIREQFESVLPIEPLTAAFHIMGTSEKLQLAG